MYMYVVCDIHYMLDIVYCILYSVYYNDIHYTEYSVSNIDTLRSTCYTVYSVYTIHYTILTLYSVYCIRIVYTLIKMFIYIKLSQLRAQLYKLILLKVSITALWQA